LSCCRNTFAIIYIDLQDHSRQVLEIMQGLQATFGDPRYRPSPWLVRRARLSLPLSTPDRSV